jgi:hypothetical protein
MKFTQTALLSSTMVLLATANKLGLRSLAEEDEEPDKTVDVNMSMLIDNLTFKQPLDGLCLAITTFAPSNIGLDADEDEDDAEEVVPDLPTELEDFMWIPGKQASDGLKVLAEEGICDDLYAELKQKRSNVIIPTDVVVTPIITPMEEEQNEMISERAMVNFTIPVELTKLNRPPLLLLSMVSRLANTNDGFVGFQRLPLLLSNKANVVTINDMIVPAWDSGTELNTQLCVDMPMSTVSATVECEGVESSNGNPQPGEGKVHIHRGIHLQTGRGQENKPTDVPSPTDAPVQNVATTNDDSNKPSPTGTKPSESPTTRNLVDATTTSNKDSKTTPTTNSDDSNKPSPTGTKPSPTGKDATTTTTNSDDSNKPSPTGTKPSPTTDSPTRNLVDEPTEKKPEVGGRLGAFDYAFHNPIANVVVASFWTEQSSN